LGSGSAKAGGVFLPSEGKNSASRWERSPLAVDQISAGLFDMAMHRLSRQLGVVNFAPLMARFLSIYNAANTFFPLPHVDSLTIPMVRSPSDLPDAPYKLAGCVEMLKEAYVAVTEGKFSASQLLFQDILLTLPLLAVEKKAQVQEVTDLVDACREYTTAMRLEAGRRESTDANRQAALATYFTRCKLQVVHIVLGLRMAIKHTYTAKNFKTCAALCRRLLEIGSANTNPNVAKHINIQQVKSALSSCEQTPTDAGDMKYSETDAFVLCAETLTPMSRTEATVRCPYCQSLYKREFAGRLCRTCMLSKIGAEATGMMVFFES